VLWVGLPVVRGPKATADTLFLDSLYRDAAGKAGITYVDVWDGFADEGGPLPAEGPGTSKVRSDRLRSYDGVYFTKARAHASSRIMSRREITRLLAAAFCADRVCRPNRLFPTPNALPGQPGGRVLSGRTDRSLGGLLCRRRINCSAVPGGSRGPVTIDATGSGGSCSKGEPLSAPAGRADDFALAAPRKSDAKRVQG